MLNFTENSAIAASDWFMKQKTDTDVQWGQNENKGPFTNMA